ncbi:MAG: dienelactone hydrolase family protein [Pirellulales bacterium]|nr:dienelactone hydrolase family protein [Pirellulales bacterium]
MPSIQWNGPKAADWIVVLAHGAGAGMDSDFMQFMAEALAERGLRVGRFNFPYMERAVTEGKRRPPDAMKKLLVAWEEVIRQVFRDLNSTQRLAIGGKSMGGRIASMSTHLVGVNALICLGYPFHPPGKPEKLRTEHLSDIKVPTLIVQGERDIFGRKEEVQAMKIPRRFKKKWLSDGDHSFKPRKASGLTVDDNLSEAVNSVACFLKALD